jgi:hypothetical protein
MTMKRGLRALLACAAMAALGCGDTSGADAGAVDLRSADLAVDAGVADLSVSMDAAGVDLAVSDLAPDGAVSDAGVDMLRDGGG